NVRKIEDVPWLEIAPPPGEIRYLPSSQVERIGGTTTTAAASPAPVPQAGGDHEPAPPVPRPKASGFPMSDGPDSRLVEAQRAEEAGDRERAIQLLTAVGNDYARTNEKLANSCFHRAARLKQQTGLAPAVTCCQPAPNGPATLAPSAPDRVDNRGVPSAGLPPVGQNSVAGGSWQPINPKVQGGQVLQSSFVQNPPQAPPNQPTRIGRLYKAGRTLEDHPTYRLEAPGSFLYVLAQPGGDLEKMVGQKVELTGKIVYRGDLRANLLTVSQVHEAK